MLDPALEPAYNLSKKHSLLAWILKLIVYMANDSTPLLMVAKQKQLNQYLLWLIPIWYTEQVVWKRIVSEYKTRLTTLYSIGNIYEHYTILFRNLFWTRSLCTQSNDQILVFRKAYFFYLFGLFEARKLVTSDWP